MKPEKREHLGDGLYVHFTGYSFEISVNDHRNPPVAVFEPDAVDRLKDFKDRWMNQTEDNTEVKPTNKK